MNEEHKINGQDDKIEADAKKFEDYSSRAKRGEEIQERRNSPRDRYLAVDQIENMLSLWGRSMSDGNYIVCLEELIKRAKISLENRLRAVRKVES